MALIELTSNLSVKAGQTNTTENGTFRVRQGNNTERTTEFTDEQVREQYKKFKPDEDQLITHKIGDGYKGTNQDAGFVRGGFILNTDRQVEDTKRLTKFLSTPKGFLFKTKQSILQKGNARPETRQYDRTSIIRNVDSTTAILNGNVSEAGETRHRDRGNYEETLRHPAGLYTYFDKPLESSVHIDRPNDEDKFYDASGKGRRNANTKLLPNLDTTSGFDQGGMVGNNKQGWHSNRFGPEYEGQPRFSGKPYEKSGKFFNVGQEEIGLDTDTTAPTVEWEGDPNRIQGIKNAVAYFCLLYTSPSPRDAHESRMPSSA